MRHPAVHTTVDFYSAAQYHEPGHTDFTGGGWSVDRPGRNQLRFTYRTMRRHGMPAWWARHIILTLISAGHYGSHHITGGTR